MDYLATMHGMNVAGTGYGAQPFFSTSGLKTCLAGLLKQICCNLAAMAVCM